MNVCSEDILEAVTSFGLTWAGAVVCSRVPHEARSAALALGPAGAVDAAEALAGVGLTHLGGPLRVGVPAAVAWYTHARCFVEAGAALVTPRAGVPGEALVTCWGATVICTGTRRHA